MIDSRLKVLIYTLLKNYDLRQSAAFSGEDANQIWFKIQEGILNSRAFSVSFGENHDEFIMNQVVAHFPLTKQGEKLWQSYNEW